MLWTHKGVSAQNQVYFAQHFDGIKIYTSKLKMSLLFAKVVTIFVDEFSHLLRIFFFFLTLSPAKLVNLKPWPHKKTNIYRVCHLQVQVAWCRWPVADAGAKTQKSPVVKVVASTQRSGSSCVSPCILVGHNLDVAEWGKKVGPGQPSYSQGGKEVVHPTSGITKVAVRAGAAFSDV